MIEYKKMKVGKKYVQAIGMELGSKNLIVFKGSKGYIMCGYLNLAMSRKLKDVAIKITGVSTIADACKANVYSFTPAAGKLGVYKGQPVKETLKIIA